MGNFTLKSNRCLRKTTAAGMIPLLLVQVSVAAFCVPQTLTAGTETHQRVTWKELPVFLDGEEQVTIRFSDGAVRGDVVSVQENGIHLQRITMATDRQRYPRGEEALVPRGAVKEIRFETLQGNMRSVGTVIGGFAGPILLGRILPEFSDGATAMVGLVAMTVGFGWLGYSLGKNADRKTTIITIAD